MKKNILVLDDSPFTLRMISDLLVSWNYAVTPVGDGRTACEKLKSGSYDLIVTDLNMPGMDGIEFAGAVRSLPGCRFLPIVMFSGEKNEERIARAKKVGVSTFLSKPLKEAQLKTILHITLNQRKATRFPMKVDAVYSTDRNPAGGKTASCTFNLSLGGAFLETGDPLPPGTRLHLTFSLPEESAPVQGEGRVAWVNSPLGDGDHPSGMGVEFLKLENREALQRFFQGSRP